MKINRGLVGMVLSSSLFLNSNSYSQKPVNNYNPNKEQTYLKCFDKAKKIVSALDEDEKDYWQTPKETKERGRGDCEDCAFYLYDLLDKKSVKSRVVFGDYYNGEKWYGHMWVEYKHEGVILILDPRAGRICIKDKAKDYIEFKDKEPKDKVRDFIEGYKKDPDFKYSDMIKA